MTRGIRLFQFAVRMVRHPVGQNALALYLVQGARYLLPLVTVPYLARVLGADAWGAVLFAQSFAIWLVLVLEYGFNLSATRDIARHREDEGRVTQIVAGVLGAKGVLLVASGVGALLGLWLVPMFRERPHYLLWAWFFALGSGLSPLWYFQGRERMRPVALLDLLSRVIATAGIFLFVGSPVDGWRVLALQAVAGLIATAIGLMWVYRSVRFCWPSLALTRKTLRDGWSMFLFRSASSLYTSANAFMLGLFALPTQVAFYGGAERLGRTLLTLMQPLLHALYPRMSHLMRHDPQQAGRLTRLSLIVMSAVGVLVGGGLFALAPLVVRLLLGEQFGAAVPVLRVLALVFPVNALSNVLGMQWMLPLGLDRAFNALFIGAGLLSVGLAVIVAPRFGALGMAWVAVAAESFLTLGMILTLWRRRLNPFTYQGKAL